MSSFKFRLSEKYTKFEKIFLMVLTNQLIYLVNIKTMTKIFSNYVCFSESPNFNRTALCDLKREKNSKQVTVPYHFSSWTIFNFHFMN